MSQASAGQEQAPVLNLGSDPRHASGEGGAESIIDNLPIGIFVVDVSADGGFRFASGNHTLASTLKVLCADATDRWLDCIAGGREFGPLAEHLEKCLATKLPVVFEWASKIASGTAYLECHIAPIRDGAGEVKRIVGTVTDRTLQRRAERQLLHNALHDNLTALPNRVLFMDRLEATSTRAAGDPDRIFCLLFINIDRFKVVNESLGHLAGDELLIAIANRLKKCARPEDTLARLGGDEFVVLIEELTDVVEARDIGDMIHKRMRVPFNLGGAEVLVSLSIGIAARHGGDTDIESLMSDASLALTQAKKAGKGRSEIFSPAIKHRSRSLLQLETDLRRAIARQELELYYQPLVSLESGRIVGFEALSRWHHPDRGMIFPGEFITLAEETGLIGDIGKWSLHEACRQQKAWLTRFPDHADLTVSVNVSSLQFADDSLIEEVRETLIANGLDGGALKLEITETVIMERPELATAVLNELKAMNIGFAIDDFGTGYSSLSYLNRFPIDILKIDCSFVWAMHENEESYKIVQVLASLASTLGLTLVAEGIENERQLKDLRDLGCDIGQGYLFSRPVAADQAEVLLAATGPLWRDPPAEV